jgi:hypothetical protein
MIATDEAKKTIEARALASARRAGVPLPAGKSVASGPTSGSSRGPGILGVEVSELLRPPGGKGTSEAGTDLRYSALRAVTGEIDAARVAGMMAAKNALMASAFAATVSASGSQMETP